MSPSHRLAPSTFTPKQICAALEIPHGTLNSWAHSGFFRGFDSESTEPGKARRYSLGDLTRLSLMKYFIHLGIPVGRARAIATVCYHTITDLSPLKITKFKFLMSMDGSFHMPLLNNETIETRLPVGTPAPPIPMEVVVYPSVILAEVLRRIEALGAVSQSDGSKSAPD
jgi:hypothetical protein